VALEKKKMGLEKNGAAFIIEYNNNLDYCIYLWRKEGEKCFRIMYMHLIRLSANI
jgi:hypothetical protein